MGACCGSAGKYEAEKVVDDFNNQVNEAAQSVCDTLDPGLSSRVELAIKVLRLKKKMSVQAFVHAKTMEEGENFAYAGKTEVARDTNSPSFVRSVIVDYSFEQQKLVRIELYAMKAEGKGCPREQSAMQEWQSQQEYLGSCQCKLAEVVAEPGGVYELPLGHHTKKGKKPAVIQLIGEEMNNLKYNVGFTMRGVNLLRMDFFSRSSDPFVTISRKAGETEANIFRSEVVKRNRNPVFKHVELPVQSLCRGESERPIYFDLSDWNLTQDSQPMGRGETTYTKMKEAAAQGKSLEIPVFLRKADGSKGSPAGKMVLDQLTNKKSYSFLDYVQGGMEVALTVAVDFTLSNRDPVDPRSLHHMDRSNPNDYVLAIRGVGDILQYYDSDKKYPVYGFGAKVPPSHVVSSPCFSLKGNFYDPEVDGIEGIVDAYSDALGMTQLHGPTTFAPIVKLASDFSAVGMDEPDNLKYTILLILTDGVINDMEKTINEIVRASRRPMSIIIVGVGEEDFGMMDKLDADEEPLWSTEEKCFMERDIVQFVKFNDYKHLSPMELALATLDEIPREVVSFFKSRHKEPKPLERKAKGPDAVVAEPSSPIQDVNAVKSVEEEKEDAFELPQFLRDTQRKQIAACVKEGWSKDECQEVIERGIGSADPAHMLDMLEAIKKGVDIHKVGKLRRSVTLNEHKTVQQGAGGAWGATGKNFAQLSPKEQEDLILRSELPGAVPNTSLADAGRQTTLDLGDGTIKVKKKKKKNEDDAEERKLCCICMDKQIDTVILECGHKTICEQCSKDCGLTQCPLCRQDITRIVRTYDN